MSDTSTEIGGNYIGQHYPRLWSEFSKSAAFMWLCRLCYWPPGPSVNGQSVPGWGICSTWLTITDGTSILQTCYQPLNSPELTRMCSYGTWFVQSLCDGWAFS